MSIWKWKIFLGLHKFPGWQDLPWPKTKPRSRVLLGKQVNKSILFCFPVVSLVSKIYRLKWDVENRSPPSGLRCSVLVWTKESHNQWLAGSVSASFLIPHLVPCSHGGMRQWQAAEGLVKYLKTCIFSGYCVPTQIHSSHSPWLWQQGKQKHIHDHISLQLNLSHNFNLSHIWTSGHPLNLSCKCLSIYFILTEVPIPFHCDLQKTVRADCPKQPRSMTLCKLF